MTTTHNATPNGSSTDLVGASEAAEILGISTPNFSHHRRAEQEKDASPFPTPIAELKCGPIWSRSDIESYAFDFNANRRRRRSSGEVEAERRANGQSRTQSLGRATGAADWPPPLASSRVDLPAPVGR